jgi:TPR repeat protein
MYYYGRGLPQNYTEALQSFARAAKAGNSDGMYNAGLMHKEGRGTAANVTEVRKLATFSHMHIS